MTCQILQQEQQWRVNCAVVEEITKPRAGKIIQVSLKNGEFDEKFTHCTMNINIISQS